jgi:hypothetical protein
LMQGRLPKGDDEYGVWDAAWESAAGGNFGGVCVGAV